MKKYIKEIVILLIQLFVFYIFPMFAKPDDAMGMTLFIILVTLVLSLIIGVISKEKIKFAYPAVIAVLFIPSVFIFYNESALIHSVWHFIFATAGMVIGTIINRIIRWIALKCPE